MPKEPMLSILEALSETGLSNTYLYLLLRTGKVKGEKDQNGKWWIPRSQVEELKSKAGR